MQAARVTTCLEVIEVRTGGGTALYGPFADSMDAYEELRVRAQMNPGDIIAVRQIYRPVAGRAAMVMNSNEARSTVGYDEISYGSV